MSSPISSAASRLVRRLREEARLTQRELADRVGTTQSVISRLESDDYEGHSLSMLYRIASALNRRIAVTTVGDERGVLAVRERRVEGYGAEEASTDTTVRALSRRELDRFAERIAKRFADRGVSRADVDEAIRWARRGAGLPSVAELRGAIKVEAGDVATDIRRARRERGREARSR